jgi:hypothetical protein
LIDLVRNSHVADHAAQKRDEAADAEWAENGMAFEGPDVDEGMRAILAPPERNQR